MHNAVLETPVWFGQTFFDIDDPPVSRPLPRMPLDCLPWGQANIDLFGYFQFQEAVANLSVTELRRWYSFKPEWAAYFQRARPYYIAAALRRGDYLQMSDVFAIISEDSYLIACERYGLDSNALIFVGEELRTDNPPLDNQGLGFLTDFLTVMNADVVLRANSTFSWWAALLGGAKVYSPLVEHLTGYQTVEYVEGNWPRMCDSVNTRTRITDLYVPP
jgi:hypothetical protein